MTFTLLPAVDVADGRAVGVARGEDGTTAAAGDPLETALSWQRHGAEWVHLVDLDAAFGRGSNSELLASVTRQLDVDVELSGGICDDDTLERALATDCRRIILGTAALSDRSWCARVIAEHGDRIAVGLDVRISEKPDGSRIHRLAARGGGVDVGELWEAIEQLDRAGCARFVITDVSKDGMLQGPNVDLYRAVADVTSTPVIASGGISEIADLVTLAEAAQSGAHIEGSIVGKALYAGRFTLAEALESMRDVEAKG